MTSAAPYDASAAAYDQPLQDSQRLQEGDTVRCGNSNRDLERLALAPFSPPPWIPEPSATGLREADLNVLAKLGEQGLQWRLEAEAFARREVCGEDDLLDILFGHSVDIQVTRQPST